MRKKLKSYNAEKPDWLAEISEFLEDPWSHLKPFDFHHRYIIIYINVICLDKHTLRNNL